jgi:hypothetical protein
VKLFSKNKTTNSMLPSNLPVSVPWHIKSVKEIEEILDTSIKTGLTAEEAEKRIADYGFQNIHITV